MTEKIVYQFDAYCKRTLQNEKVDYYRQKQYRMNHEVFLSDDIVNITLHFFLKDVRSMLPPAVNHSIAVS